MKLQFGSVLLLDEVDKLGGQKGLWTASTSSFRAEAGYSVELDTTTNLVTIRHAKGGVIVVPRERVKRFEPKAEDETPVKP